VTATRVVLCALAVTGATPGAGARDCPPHAYVFAFGEVSHAAHVDLDQLGRIRRGRTSDFLWFCRAGRASLVTDAATLAAGRAILQPLWDLGREQEAVSERLKPLEAKEEELDRQEDRLDDQAERLEDRDDPKASEERRGLDAQKRRLAARRRELEAAMREIEAEERGIDDREREAESIADAKVAELIEDALRRGLARPLP
jgi:uncharacterized protein (DUF3084 family)